MCLVIYKKIANNYVVYWKDKKTDGNIFNALNELNLNN